MNDRRLIIAVALAALAFAGTAWAIAAVSPLNSVPPSGGTAYPPVPAEGSPPGNAETGMSAAGTAATRSPAKTIGLGNLPEKAVLAAKRIVLEKIAAAIEGKKQNLSPVLSSVASAEEEVSTGEEDSETVASGETESGGASAGGSTAATTEASDAVSNEKLVEGSAAAGAAMGGFWKLAWAKTKPLLIQTWRFIVSVTAGFFGALWAPAPLAENAANAPAADGGVNSPPAAETVPVNASP